MMDPERDKNSDLSGALKRFRFHQLKDKQTKGLIK